MDGNQRSILVFQAMTDTSLFDQACGDGEVGGNRVCISETEEEPPEPIALPVVPALLTKSLCEEIFQKMSRANAMASAT